MKLDAPATIKSIRETMAMLKIPNLQKFENYSNVRNEIESQHQKKLKCSEVSELQYVSDTVSSLVAFVNRTSSVKFHSARSSITTYRKYTCTYDSW